MTSSLRAALRCAGLALPAVVAAAPAVAQTHTLALRLSDAATGEPLAGASVSVAGTRRGAVSDANGRAVLADLPAGRVALRLTSVGYAPLDTTLTLPLAAPGDVPLSLVPDEDELDELVVSTTRTARTLADSPTRVEAIGAEELGEKITMDPSGLTMVLSESPGIAVQPTSAVSGNATFRIQGLDGRYTQLLRDGLPLYGGFSGSLSLLQVPPLDLVRVEVVKGPAGALYGGDAIAGLVNLVTKTPDDLEDGRERSLLLNATSAGGADAAVYVGGRGPRRGGTVLATGNVQRAYDAEDDGFTNLPATRRATLAPTVYFYGERTTVRAGLSATAETRDGGALAALRGGNDAAFAERNRTARVTGVATVDHAAGPWRFGVRTSGSLFHRDLTTPGRTFSGDQRASTTDATAARTWGRHALVAGVDLRTDAFDGHDGDAAGLDHAHTTAGVFAQDTWDVAAPLALDLGLRVDRHSAFGTFVLPRASALVRLGHGATLRAGGGLGYKAPTVFVEAAETRAFVGLAPLGPDARAETSVGGTVDLGWRGIAGGVAIEAHQALYATRLRRPVLPVDAHAPTLVLRNARGRIDTRGAESTVRVSSGDVSLFLGYVFLDAALDTAGVRRALPLTARHRTYSVLVWEREERMRVGVEAYHTGSQRRLDGTATPGYWLTGVLGEVAVREGVRVFVNLENLLDTRQSRTEPLVSGPVTAPVFADLWAPTDGFVANAGVRVAW